MTVQRTTPIVAALLLASGMSQRFGTENKLLATIDGCAIVRRTVETYVRAGLHGVWVVVGYGSFQVMDALAGLDVSFVRNPDFAAGQSWALRHGVRTLPDIVDAVIIGVADQPFLTTDVIHHLIAAHETSDAPIVAPRYAGRRGNPVLFRRELFDELLAVQGDQGGRSVIESHRENVTWLDISDELAGMDIDIPEDLKGGSRAQRTND